MKYLIIIIFFILLSCSQEKITSKNTLNYSDRLLYDSLKSEKNLDVDAAHYLCLLLRNNRELKEEMELLEKYLQKYPHDLGLQFEYKMILFSNSEKKDYLFEELKNQINSNILNFDSLYTIDKRTAFLSLSYKYAFMKYSGSTEKANRLVIDFQDKYDDLSFPSIISSYNGISRKDFIDSYIYD